MPKTIPNRKTLNHFGDFVQDMILMMDVYRGIRRVTTDTTKQERRRGENEEMG